MNEPAAGPVYAELTPGDPLPRFVQWAGKHRRLAWDSMAGRYLLFCTFMTAADPMGRSAIEAIAREAGRFDDVRASVFAVGVDPSEGIDGLLHDCGPGVHTLWDADRVVSRVLGSAPREGPPGAPDLGRRAWVLIDPTLHVLAVVPFDAEDPEHRAIFRLVETLAPPERFGGMAIPPPVLVLPNVFGPDLCALLIGLHERNGGVESDVLLDNTSTVDGAFKRRQDCAVEDAAVIARIGERLFRCVLPEVQKLFFMPLRHFDRPVVSCYRAEDGGHYLAHRDNGSRHTAHRRFAVSVNLNDDFEGGEVYFPEYGAARVKCPAGWAVVFPCAILHGVTTVTAGRRFAFLPFMFDDEGARIKAANAAAAP